MRGLQVLDPQCPLAPNCCEEVCFIVTCNGDSNHVLTASLLNFNRTAADQERDTTSFPKFASKTPNLVVSMEHTPKNSIRDVSNVNVARVPAGVMDSRMTPILHFVFPQKMVGRILVTA